MDRDPTLHQRLLRAVDDATDEGGSLVRALGLGPADAPGLGALVLTWPATCDDDTDAAWVPLLACQALAELGDPAAVTTLLDVLDDLDHEGDDVGLEELPKLAVEIGAAVLDPLAAYLRDVSHRQHSRAAACEALEDLARHDAALRDRVVEVLASVLTTASRDDATVGGFVVAALAGLGAVEHAELMRAAIAARVVNTGISGDWDLVAYELGIGPAPRDDVLDRPSASASIGRVSRDAQARAQNKAKRKQQKAARKKGRRR